MRMTIDEIKLITFVMVAVLAGSSAKYYRVKHPRALIATPTPRPIIYPGSHP